MANVTQIPAPRVPIIDERTGLISREWFRFFNNLFTLLGDGTTDDITQFLQVSPASETTSVSQLAETAKALQALDVTPAHTPQLARYVYGAFHDSTTQTAAVINTAYPITFGFTDVSVGATRGTPTSRIYVDRPGTYNFQFSAQLNKISALAGNVWVWYRVNGTNAADTARQVTLAGTGALTVATSNFVLNMNAGDYFELVWSTGNIDCQIVNIAATAPVPAIPSVILTVTSNISA